MQLPSRTEVVDAIPGSGEQVKREICLKVFGSEVSRLT